MNIDILRFLMENSVRLSSEITNRKMIADEMYVMGGEFVVYIDNDHPDVYRGTDFEEAMRYLNGEEE